MPRLLLLLALLSLGCRDATPQARLADTLPLIPLPEGAEKLSREGGPDAVLIRFQTAKSATEVAGFYRAVFSKAPWKLANEITGANGELTLYAEGEPRPMWVRITPADSTGYTHVEMAGANTQ